MSEFTELEKIKDFLLRLDGSVGGLGEFYRKMKIPGSGLRAESLLGLLSGMVESQRMASISTGCISTSYTATSLITLTTTIHFTRSVR